MSEFEIGNLLYLILLGSVLVFWVFVQNREKLGQKLQQMVVWGLIFLGTIAAIGLWEDIRRTVIPTQAVFAEEGRIELPRSPDGHYYATVDLNGVPTRFVVDTGATSIVLTLEDARRAGMGEDGLIFFSEAMTANGPVRTAPVTLKSVAIGPFVDRDVPAFVNEGEMEQSLLGMSYLQRYARLEISDGRLVLER
ncbi:TIGR02281 family clan AA aspartic protease [Aestuariicoccus sp. MJ-SS9]|uniref:retropepsin-like aspartic protease family protein n=1 Tax=Aestuariicoccus sp. MJ-SS9 TaxID=3079855 RepID=UPI0029071592|nr:TIGR02281 family clan AA aspartic protease [Aestuariicoccus sp. MJ-SS9]MDU8910508.1 TIGR02281 family clan AA aspartic protease [Aestuariicoccus sp. MJ-SS9]